MFNAIIVVFYYLYIVYHKSLSSVLFIKQRVKKSAVMDFARKQLEKYGWTDGKGLGKWENGISEALKPKIKRSVAGIGHDRAADFTEHWWNTLYDKAAANVQVEEKHGKTKKIKTKDESEFEITNSMWRLNKKAKNSNIEEKYTDYFVRKAVLTGGGSKTERVRIESDTESEDEKEKKDVFKMTDEELFAACEGRTAHKGARHGLKALGKLARIEQQEQMLLEQKKYEGYSYCKSKKEKSKKCLHIVEDLSFNSDADVSETKIKKKKKKRCSSHENSASAHDVVTNNNDIDMVESTEPKSEKNKQKPNKKTSIESIVYTKTSEINDRVNFETNSDTEKMDVNEEIKTKSKKKKSNKRKNTDTSDLETVEYANDSLKNISKKIKKKKNIVK